MFWLLGLFYRNKQQASGSTLLQWGSITGPSIAKQSFNPMCYHRVGEVIDKLVVPLARAETNWIFLLGLTSSQEHFRLFFLEGGMINKSFNYKVKKHRNRAHSFSPLIKIPKII